MTHALTTPENPALAAAVKIVDRLHQSGYVAYLAGGCVRDSLLGRTPKDFDIATDARPDAVLKCFRHARYVGEAFGVVLVRSEGFDFEVATFRLEWGYDDGRRPSNVEFTDAQHDAARRDFTVNGLFADPLPRPQQPLSAALVTERDDPSLSAEARAIGRIIDFVGGRADLAAGIVRAIGNPDERFAEDYLRMLRAVRFASRLGFEIEQLTARAIRVHAKFLSQISRERIGAELMPMLSIDQPDKRLRAAQLIQSLNLDGATLNEERADIALPILAALEPDAAYPAALAAWMLDRNFLPRLSLRAPSADSLAHTLAPYIESQTEKLVTRWRNALTLSNDNRDALRDALTLLPRAIQWASLSVPQKKRLLAHRHSGHSIRLAAAALSAIDSTGALNQEWQRAFTEDAARMQEHGGVAPEPIVTGDDLIARGLTPSKRFKQILDHFYDLQLEGKLTDRSQLDAIWTRVTQNVDGRGI